MKLAPQVKLVLSYLMTRGSLSRIVADTTLGIAALPRRISDLEAKGFGVTREAKKDFNGRDYTAYSMTEEQIAHAQGLIETQE